MPVKKSKLSDDRMLDLFEAHSKQDDVRFGEVIDGQTEIKGDIKTIKENHLAHIQASMTVMEVNVAKQTTNVDWLMKFFWVVATASIGGLIASLFNLLR